jgi:hypothetical protein
MHLPCHYQKIYILLDQDIFFNYKDYTELKIANIIFFFTNYKIFITMILDVDFLIDFFKKHTNEGSKGEMGEQDAPASSSPAPSTGGGGGTSLGLVYTTGNNLNFI